MGLPGRYVGKALYYKLTREQDETGKFAFEGYIFYVWHSLLCISSIAYYQYHWVHKLKINVASPEILLHHKLINYEINMQ